MIVSVLLLFMSAFYFCYGSHIIFANYIAQKPNRKLIITIFLFSSIAIFVACWLYVLISTDSNNDDHYYTYHYNYFNHHYTIYIDRRYVRKSPLAHMGALAFLISSRNRRRSLQNKKHYYTLFSLVEMKNKIGSIQQEIKELSLELSRLNQENQLLEKKLNAK